MANKLSLNRIRVTSSEIPPADGTCDDGYELHLMNGRHLLINNSALPTEIERWYDVSPNQKDYKQVAQANMPKWNGKSYDFDGSDAHMSQVGTGVTGLDEFTIGFALSTTASISNGVLIADSTSNQDFIRLANHEQIDIKADNQLRSIVLDSNLPDETPYHIILQRRLNVIRVYVNGTLQSNTATNNATKLLDINTIGVRNSLLNDYIGSIGEVIVYSCGQNAVLAAMIQRLNFVIQNM